MGDVALGVDEGEISLVVVVVELDVDVGVWEKMGDGGELERSLEGERRNSPLMVNCCVSSCIERSVT